MSFMRFSAAPAGRLSDRSIPWAIFGERPGDPDGLEGNALAGLNLAQIASTPGAPMFEAQSLFGAHMANLPVGEDPTAPMVVFVHGFGYEPRRPVAARARSDNAHRALFHFAETPDGPGSAEERALRTTPWFARALLEGGHGAPEDLRGDAVGYCFSSCGGDPDPFLPGWSQRVRSMLPLSLGRRQPPETYVNAYRDAEQAGFGLAAVLTQLRARLDHAGQDERRIDIVCHSVGARTVMSALALVAQRYPEDHTIARIDRVIVLAGTCYLGQAAFALANILFADAPHAPSFFNVMSKSDDVLRFLASRDAPESAVAEAVEDLSLDDAQKALLRRGDTIGWSGLPPHALYEFFGGPYPHWVDIPLDTARVRGWGRDHGFDLRGGQRLSLGDHWIHFTHPGNWDLYRAILLKRDGWGVEDIRNAIS